MNQLQLIDAEIEKLQAMRKAIQDECCHPKLCLTIQNHSGGDEWSRQEYYWRSYHCGLCDKRWSDEQ